MVQRRRVDRRRATLVGDGRSAAGGSRSTASGSTSAPTSGRRGSSRSGSTRRRPPAAPSRLASSSRPPGEEAPRTRWALRSTDVDLHGHVNNAVYWQALESVLGSGAARRLVAELDFRDPIDLADALELAVERSADGLSLGFCVGASVRALARVDLSDEG